METSPAFWRKCSSCKKPIPFSQKYWICSVSTCNRIRTGLAFCSVTCFDAHIPIFNHRNSGAIEKCAPTLAVWQREQAPRSPVPRTPSSAAAPMAGSPAPTAPGEKEILVVVSKVKAYIRARSGMNTSDSVMALLTDRILQELKDAMRRTSQEGRQIVMDRDCRV